MRFNLNSLVLGSMRGDIFYFFSEVDLPQEYKWGTEPYVA